MRRNTIGVLAAVVAMIVTLLGLTGSAADAASAYQFGRTLTGGDCCGGQYLDGIWSYGDPYALAPNQNGCAIASVLIYEPRVSQNFETGSSRCLDFYIDNPSCTSGGQNAFLFDETYSGDGNYSCENDGNQAVFSKVSYSVRLTRLSGGYLGAYLGGHLYREQAGYNANYMQAFDWGEAIDVSDCGSSWNIDAYFGNVLFYNRNTGFNSVPVSDFISFKSGDCGHTGAYTSGTTGGFEVYHE